MVKLGKDTMEKKYKKVLIIGASSDIGIETCKKFLENESNIKIFIDLENMIGSNGRMLLRPSGTENLIRLLIEHKDVNQIEILYKYFYDNINKNTIA